jgi:hypothetical protein
MNRKTFLFTITQSLIFMTGALNTAATEKPPIYIMRDRSDAKYEHRFFFRNNEVFLSKAIFPGYDQPAWYYLPKLPEPIRVESEKWCAKDGSPTSPSGGETWFSRTIIPSDPAAPRKISFFIENKGEDKEMLDWFLRLRRLVAKRGLRTKKLPNWIDEEPRISKEYGLTLESTKKPKSKG